jgi:hypothetical protein
MKKPAPRRIAPRPLSSESLEGLSGGAGKIIRFGSGACDVCGYLTDDPEMVDCPKCNPPASAGGGGGGGFGFAGNFGFGGLSDDLVI